MKWRVSFIKAIGYRALSITVQVIFVYFLAKFLGLPANLSLGLGVAVIPLNIILMITYALYDRLFEKLHIKWTLRSKQPGIFPRKLRAFLDILRPATLLPAAVVGVLGAVVVGLKFWPFAILFGIMLVMMQGGGQALNQSNPKEIELDRMNRKDYRPTVSGILSSKEAYAAAYGCLSAGVIISAIIGVWWLGAFMASTAILYTQEPFYLKRFFPVNLLVQAAGRGFLPIYTLGYMSGRDTLPLAIFFFVWVFALQSTKDFGDYAGDKRFGIMTLPVLVGKKPAKIIMLGITIVDYIFAIASGMWFLLIIAPLDVSAILTCEKDWKIVENSLGWALYYASLGIGTVVGLAFL